MAQVVITQADPAAGADFTVTVPAGKFWKILSISALFTTDATAASRNFKLFIDDGTDKLYMMLNNGGGQTASIACQYSLAPYCTPETTAAASSTVKYFGLPVMVLAAGYRITTSTGAIQVTDQWSKIRLLVDQEVMEFGLNRRQME